MAIYHLCTKIIGRSSGRTATAAAAYRAGVRIKDERTGILFDYSRRKHIGWRAIAAPENSPSWIFSREELWNAVELAEKRGDAQLAREVEISLPLELSKIERLALIAEFVDSTFVQCGMVADIAVHDNHGNPHAHVLLTMRELLPNGFGKKVRGWNDKQSLEQWRETWSIVCNQALAKAGHRARIDHRSLIKQGINREPTRHEGANRKAKYRKALARHRANKFPQTPTRRIEMGDTNNDTNAKEPAAMTAGISSLDKAQPAMAGKPLTDTGYQKEIREHFGERVHAVQYDNRQKALDIRIKGGCLRDHGDRITVKFGGLREEVEAIVELAQLKGWKSIHIHGGEDFRRNLWREATRCGFCPDAIKGYEPTTEDWSRFKEKSGQDEGKGTQSAKNTPYPDPLHPLQRLRLRR